jgi:DNA-binding CsgD family transcriptional regulator
VGVTDNPRLTPRQAEILGLISSGYSNAEIGLLLGTTEETVKTHSKKIFLVLGARNRAHAVTRGFQLGLLSIDSLEPSFAPSSESPYE